jgi:hypothetical protein
MQHLGIVMSAIKASWDQDKEKAVAYIQFLIETLEKEGEYTQAKNLKNFLEHLEGKKEGKYVFPAYTRSGNLIDLDS